MRAHQRLVLLAGASGAVLILLGHMAHRAAEQLLEVPPQSWGLSELSDAIVAGTCAFGTLGALWHVISALLALMTLPRADGPGSLRRGGASALAARLLEAWGAPAVRRITASALLVSLSSAPALAAEGTAGGDDLGWHPTSSAPASPPSQSSTPSPQADQPAPEATAGTGASQSRSESSTASAEQAPSTGSSASDRSSQSAEPPSPSSSRAQSSAHLHRRARREPVVDHRPPSARRIRPRTDRAGLAGPVSRQLRRRRRRPVTDPARHGPECPGLPVSTEHDDRRPGAITMNRTAPAPTASTVGLECRHQFTSHFVPTGHPPTLRSPP